MHVACLLLQQPLRAVKMHFRCLRESGGTLQMLTGCLFASIPEVLVPVVSRIGAAFLVP